MNPCSKVAAQHRLSNRYRRALTVITFWAGEIIGGLSVISIPFLLLFLGDPLQ